MQAAAFECGAHCRFAYGVANEVRIFAWCRGGHGLQKKFSAALIQERKVFFSEEKQRKTADCFGFRITDGARSNSQRFLASCNCQGMEIASTEGKRQSKRFFFEKKHQKTLTNSG
jgi:hypothetical protein